MIYTSIEAHMDAETIIICWLPMVFFSPSLHPRLGNGPTACPVCYRPGTGSPPAEIRPMGPGIADCWPIQVTSLRKSTYSPPFTKTDCDFVDHVESSLIHVSSLHLLRSSLSWWKGSILSKTLCLTRSDLPKCQRFDREGTDWSLKEQRPSQPKLWNNCFVVCC